MSIKTILVISMIIVAVNADIVFLNEDAKKACPKFSCKSANAKATETCVKGKGKLTESRTVDVSPCFKDETCPAGTSIENLTSDSDVDVKCAPVTAPTPVEHFALPGEACVADKKQCKAVSYFQPDGTRVPNPDGTCTNSLCVGSVENSKCDTLESCELKFYCNGMTKDAQGVVTPGTCKPLIKKDIEGCTRSKECEAGLVCLSFTKDTVVTKKCSDLGLLENGTEVVLANAEDADYKALACKSGVVNPAGKCSDYKYDAEATKIVDGKVVCIPGEVCKYNYLIKEEKTADTKQCQCAYDANGSGFCPYSSHDAVAVDRHNAIIKIKIENLKNTGVHPEHRSDSVNKDESKSQGCLAVYGDVRIGGSVDCFKTILNADKCTAVGSGNFLNYSIVAIIAILAMFF